MPNPKALIKHRLWGCLAVLLVCSGCASIWQPVPPVLSTATWSVNPPQGWMRLTTPTYEMLTRDGPYLQYIFIQEQPFSQGLKHTRQTMNADMLAHEAATVITDSLRSDPQIRQFRLLQSGPATLGGKMGFRLIYTYTDRQGVDTKCDYYGVLLPGTFFSIRYTAAERFYFDKDHQAFKQMISSLRFS